MQCTNKFDVNKEYSKHNIIPPPTLSPENLDNLHKYRRVVIDSKNRDISLFPEQCNYTIPLDDDIDDVISAKLLSADIPLSMYMINKYFNTFYLKLGNNTYNIILDHGNYNGGELASLIQTKLNLVNNIFTVIFNTNRENLTITAGSPFSLDFSIQEPNTNLCYLLGFKKNIANAVNINETYTLISDYRINFNYNNYLIINIDQFKNNKSIDQNIHDSFCIAPRIYNTQSLIDLPDIRKVFNPIISRLSKLTIFITDRFGNPMDFQNVDHRLEFLFTSFKQKFKYQNIFLNR